MIPQIPPPEPVEPPICGECGSPLPQTCGACGARMPSGFRFCGLCGAALARECAACGAVMPASFRFCGHCAAELPWAGDPHPAAAPEAVARRATAGRRLGSRATVPIQPRPEGPVDGRAPAEPAAAPASAVEQRRRVAILFADLTGSTALADRLDPEASYRIVSECIAGLGGIITEGGGYVVKTLGDGLMALFGAPVAHGDDPLRAGLTALRLQEWMYRYTETVEREHDVLLRLRVGVNYGSVVAAPILAGGRPEYDVLGDSVNVAQRVESAAEPGTVCVSEPFYRITHAAFEYRDRGTARVKGKPEPLHLYQLVAPRPEARRPFETDGLPLVGREAELAALHAAARDLAAGRGALVALTGAPGLGKTRLLEELTRELGSLGIPYLRGTASETGRAAPFSLWRSWLLELLPIDARMDHAEAARAIREALTDPEQQPWAEWLAALAVDPQRLLALDVEARERVTRGAITVFLQHWRGERPAAVLVDEGAQVDPLSLRLLLAAGGDSAGPPLLVTLAGRDERDFPPAGARAIPLGPLDDRAAASLIEQVLPAVAAEESLRAHVVRRAGGSPLFLDMLLRAALEAGDPLEVLSTVPDTVYALVQAQLDSLRPHERHAATSGAVLGRVFAERWLDALCGDGGTGAQGAGGAAPPWHALETRELLVEERPPPLRELAFRHGAFQEVLYESLLKAQRREVHGRAAQVIAVEAELRPDLAATVAWHLRCAEAWQGALEWSIRAAEYAESLFDGGTARELYEQCSALAERLEDRSAAARAAAGLAGLAAHAGEFPRALELYADAERLLDALERAMPRPEPALLAHRASVELGHARVLGQTGAAGEARPLLEHALGILEQASDGAARRDYARCLTEQAHLLCDLGIVEEAERAGRRALALAEVEGWPTLASAASAALGRIYPMLGDWPAGERELRRAARLAEASGDWQGAAACWINLGNGLQKAGRLGEAAAAHARALEHAERIGDAEKVALARLNSGAVFLNRGDWSAAEADFRAALEQFRRMEHPLGVAASLYNLADTLRWADRRPEAWAELERAEVEVTRIESPHLQAHVAAARAEALLADDRLDEAHAAAVRAGELARDVGYDDGLSLSDLTRGRVLRAMGELEPAEDALAAALDGFTRGGAPLEAARARAELAALRAARGQAAEADGDFRQARDAIIDLDASPWLAHLPMLKVEA